MANQCPAILLIAEVNNILLKNSDEIKGLSFQEVEVKL